MRDYIKPLIEDEELELEDVIAVSNEKSFDDGADEKDPFPGF